MERLEREREGWKEGETRMRVGGDKEGRERQGSTRLSG